MDPQAPPACVIAISYHDEPAGEVLKAGADPFRSKFGPARDLMPAVEKCPASAN